MDQPTARRVNDGHDDANDTLDAIPSTNEESLMIK